MEVTKDRLINDVIQLYFQTVSPSHLASLSHEDLAAEVLTDINTKLDMENQVRPKGRKFQLQQIYGRKRHLTTSLTKILTVCTNSYFVSTAGGASPEVVSILEIKKTSQRRINLDNAKRYQI